jgi:SM-20-related protein
MRLALNARLFLGLFDFEAGYAVYPPGGFFTRHVDSFRGDGVSGSNDRGGGALRSAHGRPRAPRDGLSSPFPPNEV